MGKKYNPSGYQIINVTVYSDNGTYKMIDSEDKTLLINLLKNGIKKPILIHIKDNSQEYNIITFASILDASLVASINSGGSIVSYNFYLVNNELSIEFFES